MKEKNITLNEHSWKTTNQRYLFELQKFLDLVDNVQDEKLKNGIIYQFMQFDKTITQIAEEKMEN